MHEKVVAYEKWSLMGTINEISPKLYPSTNNVYIIKLLPSLVKIRQIDKGISIKLIHSRFNLQRVLCFVNASMNLIAFEFGNLFLVKSTETAPTVVFSCVSCLL